MRCFVLLCTLFWALAGFGAEPEYGRVVDVCRTALDSTLARYCPKPVIGDEPVSRADFDALADTMKAYLDRGHSIDAFNVSARLYYIGEKHAYKSTPAQNLDYLKVLMEVGGVRKYYAALKKFVSKVDTLDRALSFDCRMALAQAAVSANRPQEGLEAAFGALRFCDTAPQTASALIQAAFASVDNGDFLSFNALRDSIEAMSALTPEQAVSLMNLKALSANYRGRKDEAARCHKECARLAAEIYGPWSPQALYYINKEFNNSVEAGDYRAADSLLVPVVECLEANRGHCDFSVIVFNIGGYLNRRGVDGSQELMEKAWIEHLRFMGQDIGAATMAADIAYACYLSGDYDSAADYQDQAVAIYYLCTGIREPHIISYFSNAATFSAEAGRYKDSGKHAARLLTAYLTSMPDVFLTMTSKERFDFLRKEQFAASLGNLIPQLALARIADTATAYDAILAYRSILLAADLDMKKRVAASGDEVLMAAYADFCNIVKQLNRLDHKDDADKYGRLSRRADDLERALLAGTAGVKNIISPFRIYYGDVQYYLKDDEIAVEFISAQFKDGVLYGALSIGKEGKPVIDALFSAAKLDSIARQDYYNDPRLYDMVWKKLLDRYPRVKNIYFAPAGALCGIALEYLPDHNGTPLDERVGMHRLTSTRELAYRGAARSAGEMNVALFGGINYYPDESDLLDDMPDDDTERDRSAGGVGVDKSRFIGSLAFLPGTLDEVRQIGSMLENKGIRASTYLGAAGSEEAFKRLSHKGLTHIHIATHGFYLPTDNNNDEEAMLAHSGLLLAGAGTDLSEFSGADGAIRDDGVLTAGEIAGVDLSGVDLVVLSACETALGDTTGEGVFGLQRGFKKAGVKSILMSLDKVDDTATQILMQAFYAALLYGHSKTEALAAARRKLRTADGGRFDHPRYLTNFIIIDALD